MVAHIEELEKTGLILVTRGSKDNAPKQVFWNEMTEEQGGKRVDEGTYYSISQRDTPIEVEGRPMHHQTLGQ